MKKTFIILLLSTTLFAQSKDTTVVKNKPDYRNHINIPEYDPSLMPMGTTRTSTGVWTELNPKVPRVTYTGLHFMNKDTGWACGNNGAIIKTTNGGKNWIIANTPVNNIILKIHSYNGILIVAVGFNGTILRSTDRGETFSQVTSGLTADLWGIQMINDTLGWICGTNWSLLKTTNGGINWQTITAGLNEQYWALSFRNINYGMIACGGGKILKTSDGGNIWTQVQAGDIRALYTIDMIDSLHIAAAGAYGKNVYSSDGGFSWNSNPDIPASSATNCIDFIDTDTGYSVQDITNIKKTTNKGQNWFTPIPNGLEQICEWHIQILNDGCGYACGEEIGGFYALNFYKRTNWLDNWSRLFLNDNFYDVHFLNETTGFALSGSLHKTTDRGITWKRDTTAPGGTDILFIDSVTGFIAGSKIYKTTNKGEIWYQTNSLGLAAGKVFFITKQIGWALSGRNILKTTDAGENWFLQFQQIGYDSYTSIYFIDSLYGWATSRYIWQTTNGGINWVERTDIPAFMCEDIYFIGQNGFIIDEYQKLYKSTNSGNNWFVQINSPGLIKNFGWLSDKHGFIMGYSVVFETIDSGATWHLVNELNNIGLQKFHSPKTYIGYSIGSAGLIYRYFDSALIPVELITFNGEYNNSYILLNWKTSSEINNRGFEILKSSNTKNWEVIGFINGQGTTIKLNNYYFIDKNIVSEKNYYRLKQIDLDGAYKYSNIIEVRTQIENLNLSQNFPNPFNSMTNIEFSIPKKAFIKLSLYDVKGEKINELINEEKERGYYSIIINNKDLSTGIYFYRLSTSSGFSITKKLTIIK